MRKFSILGSILAVWALMGVAGHAAVPVRSQPAGHLDWNGQGRSHENQGRGHEKEKRGKKSKARFSSHDKYIIHDYFARNASSLPPGLAKRGGNLPPGLERQLREGGTLPPGLQKRVEPFPRELARRLPSLPEGYSRVILGGRALVLNRSHAIVDIMFLFR